MKRKRVIIGVVVIVAALGGFFGYQAYRRSAMKDALVADVKEFGDAYKAFQGKQGRPPSEGEMEQVIAGKPQEFQQHVRNDLQILWGVVYDPQVEGADRKAFVMDRRGIGGKYPVLFLSGDVRFLTEAETAKVEKASVRRKEQPRKQ